jgi:FMN-dependent NADH-azoreductase
LKQYVDVITQPGLTFGFTPEDGYFGLLENKKATAFVTSGVYGPGADPKYGADYHSTYLEWWLNTIGVQDIDLVRFQPSLLNADPEGAFSTALDEANKLAK